VRAAIACAVALAVIGALIGAALAGADSPAAATSYPLAGASGPTGATGASGPTGLTGGPDANPWFIASRPSQYSFFIGTVSSGKLVEFPTASPSDRPISLAAAGGKLWFTYSTGDIGGLESITPTGVLGPGARLGPSLGGMAADAAGNLWIALPLGDAVDEVAGPGYTEATDPEDGDERSLPPGARPQSLAAGPDGKTMWFTEPGIDAVASITPDGDVTQVALPLSGSLGDIVLGPDGNLWVGSIGTAGSPSALLRITPAGVVTAFDVPAGSNANPAVLAAGPDGELWLADNPGTDGGLTAVTSAGSFTSYPGILPSAAAVSSIIGDPAGADALWLSDEGTNSIYRVALSPPPAPAPTPAPTPTPAGPSAVSAAPATPPTLTAIVSAPNALSVHGATLAGTIGEAAGSSATLVSYHFEYGTSSAYGSATPSATVTATPAGAAVSATLSALAPYTTYHYRLVASDCASSACVVDSPDRTFTTGSTLQPAQNVTVGLTATAGTILIELAGSHHFVRLAAGQLIPLGATIDARHGTVLIQSAIAAGEQASGLFSHGVFVVRQPAGARVTTLVLASNFSACTAATRAPLAHAAAARKHKPKSKHVVNQVFGNAHGQFSTRGHYATAADQGTDWRTADRCDGTLISVSLGKVTVTDFVHHRRVVVRAGHHYLAQAG
jgi:virginiamycin B lyase